MYARRVRSAVKRSACLIAPVDASPSQRASPGRIGSPAASADVQLAGRSAFERRFQIAPDQPDHLPFCFDMPESS